MFSSYRLGRFFDIEVRVHSTFLMLIAWIGFSAFQRSGMRAVVSSVLFALILFSFVVLHEYGHALTARRFGVRTRGITLYPIGGVAMLESMPKKPWQQILVAIAGPAVNFVLAGIVFAIANVLGINLLEPELDPTRGAAGLLDTLFWANAVMGTFNLLPALPMDGGRVLRAALALRLPPERATRIAARVAKVIALMMAAYAIANGHFMLGLIAIFVWTASNAESRAEAIAARARGDMPYTEVLRRSPWGARGSRGPLDDPRAPAQGDVYEVVDGPNGPEVRVIRAR